jgi:hypothetical protein
VLCRCYDEPIQWYGRQSGKYPLLCLRNCCPIRCRVRRPRPHLVKLLLIGSTVPKPVHVGGPAITVDDESTWPPGLCRLFNDSLETVSAYQRERARIEESCQDDLSVRFDAPLNPFGAEWARVRN